MNPPAPPLDDLPGDGKNPPLERSQMLNLSAFTKSQKALYGKNRQKVSHGIDSAEANAAMAWIQKAQAQPDLFAVKPTIATSAAIEIAKNKNASPDAMESLFSPKKSRAPPQLFAETSPMPESPNVQALSVGPVLGEDEVKLLEAYRECSEIGPQILASKRLRGVKWGISSKTNCDASFAIRLQCAQILMASTVKMPVMVNEVNQSTLEMNTIAQVTIMNVYLLRKCYMY